MAKPTLLCRYCGARARRSRKYRGSCPTHGSLSEKEVWIWRGTYNFSHPEALRLLDVLGESGRGHQIGLTRLYNALLCKCGPHPNDDVPLRPPPRKASAKVGSPPRVRECYKARLVEEVMREWREEAGAGTRDFPWLRPFFRRDRQKAWEEAARQEKAWGEDNPEYQRLLEAGRKAGLDVTAVGGVE